MKVHTCARCEGCGYVTGAFRWEIPWTRWASDPTDPQHEAGILEAHACPDCGGTGALIELDAAPRTEQRVTGWRNLASEWSYAHHVDAVLRNQAYRH